MAGTCKRRWEPQKILIYTCYYDILYESNNLQLFRRKKSNNDYARQYVEV